MKNIPKDWTFKNKAVASQFNSHVREQLPWYDLATNAVAHFGRHFIPKGGIVYDIGASTGNIGIALSDTIKKRGVEFTAIEESEDMAALYTGIPVLEIADAVTYNYKPYDFAVCFLVVMFLPVATRMSFVRRLVGLAKPGGAFVLVEKTQSPPGYLGPVFTRLTLQQKLAGGANPDEIISKELSLAGYQRPLNESALPKGGTKFFQVGEFSGWIFTKQEA